MVKEPKQIKAKDFVHYRNSKINFDGQNNNHPVAVIVNPIPDKSDGIDKMAIITSEGCKIEPSIDKNGAKGRGVNIEIWFWSEEGGYWSMDLQFHKGDTFIHTEWITNMIPQHIKDQLETIWRD